MKKLLFFVLCVMSSQLLTAKIVGPLIQTQWDQKAPYNLMLPEVNGQRCMTSCGATVMAQLCYYYRWPEHGTNTGQLRVDGDLGNAIEVNMAESYYDYDKMLLTYDENSSEESKMAVALLMRDMAASGAVLSPDLSTSPSPGSMSLFFGYDKGLMHLHDGCFSMEDMKSIIRSELDAGRPVYLQGSNGSMGHAFICDGYIDDTDEYHLNYGWGGDSDGWSTLEDCLFPINMMMDFNIKKDEGGERGFTMGSSEDFKWLGGNVLYGSFIFEAYYIIEMQFQVALAVESTVTHEVQYFGHTNKDMTNNDPISVTWELDADLPDGTYIVYPVSRETNYNSDWKKSFFRNLCQREVALTVKDGVKTFANDNMNDYVREGAVEVDGICYELNESEGKASVTYRNDKYSSYSGNIVIPEAITVNDKTYTVTAIGSDAFKECAYLDQVIIGKNVTSIDWGGFGHVTANKITFAEGSQLKLIDEFAFYCATINEIVLPEGLEEIYRLAFGNSNLRNITIPSTVTTWGEFSFSTSSLVCIHINSMTPPVFEAQVFRQNIDNADFVGPQEIYGTSASVLYVPSGTKEAYAQADQWKDFGIILEPGDDDSFVEHITRNCIEIDGIKYEFNGVRCVARVVEIKEDLEDVIIKNTITIGGKELAVTSLYYQVINETNHRRVVIPANIESFYSMSIVNSRIGSLEFEEGSHLKRIEDGGLTGITLESPLVFPEGLEYLGHLFLRDVADITIPASVTEMGGQFEFWNLKHLRVFWPEPLVMSDLFSFAQEFDGATLHVPVGTKELYANAEGWKNFSKIVEGNDPEKGDANGDGKVDAADIVDIVNYMMGKPTSTGKFNENAADVNGDGIINVADIVSLNLPGK